MDLSGIALGLTLGIATWTDWQYKKIYNKLLGPAFLIAFSLQVVHKGWSGVWISLSGCIVGLALLLIPYLLGGIGAGDVKLLGVIGTFGGVHFVITSFLYGALLGGVVSLLILIRHNALTAALKKIIFRLPIKNKLLSLPLFTNPLPLSEDQQAACQKKFPYGIVLTAGTVLAFSFHFGW